MKDVGWEEAGAASIEVSSAAAEAVAVAAAGGVVVAIHYSVADIGSLPAVNDGSGDLRLALKYCIRGTR